MAVGPVDSDHNATDVFLDGFQYSFYGFFYALKLVRNYSICTKTYLHLFKINYRYKLILFIKRTFTYLSNNLF